MNSLIGPLVERIAIQDALAGRRPHPADVKLAAEWNYRLWRASGKPIEVEIPKEQPRWPTPAWMLDEVSWYVLGIASAGIAFVTFCLAWR